MYDFRQKSNIEGYFFAERKERFKKEEDDREERRRKEEDDKEERRRKEETDREERRLKELKEERKYELEKMDKERMNILLMRSLASFHGQPILSTPAPTLYSDVPGPSGYSNQVRKEIKVIAIGEDLSSQPFPTLVELVSIEALLKDLTEYVNEVFGQDFVYSGIIIDGEDEDEVILRGVDRISNMNSTSFIVECKSKRDNLV